MKFFYSEKKWSPQFSTLILCNSLFMGAFAVFGCISAYYGTPAVIPPPSKASLQVPGLDFLFIVLRHNLTLLVFLMAGTLTLGLSSVTLLGINGVSIGYDIVSIILTSPTDLKYLSVHLPLEVMMMLLATCSSQQIGWTFFQDLVLDQKTRVPFSAFVSLAIAVVLLFLAAVAESGFRTLRIHALL